MGCPSECVIGDDLVFSVCCHDPDTGELTDADAVPSYRIYEDENPTAILTGSMAKLDDANTTGFYTELIACTTANGFESEKNYTIYIEATVDGATGGISYAFKAKRHVGDLVAERDLTNVEDTAAKYSLAGLAFFKMKYTISGSILSSIKPGGGVFDTYTLVTTADVDPVTEIS